MNPLKILLSTLAAVPAIIVVAYVANLFANDIIETRATAKYDPLIRPKR